MLIKFYNVEDDNRVVHKTLGSEVHTINDAQVYNSVSIMNPQFLINYSAYVVNSNYLHVQAWNRYYYITDVTAMAGGRCVVHCREDVLMSNAEAIDDLSCDIVRQEFLRDKYLYDELYQVMQGAHTENHEFVDSQLYTEDFSGHPYLLTVIGGKGNLPEEVTTND